MERRLTTIMATDIVGYSRLMERDETGTLDRLKDIRTAIVEPSIEAHSGHTVKLMGDGALVTFASVVDALQCAVEVQHELGARNHAAEEQHRLHLRIAIHLGDIILEQDEIYGDGVNVAARLESIAPPGGIVISKQVYDHIGANVPIRFVPLGEQWVKNISRPIEAYRADLAGEGAGAGVIRFNDFELDTAHYELRRAGERVPVEPQVFDLLVFLARNHHRTVTKDELFEALWGERIVSDSALSSQIKAARRALGDDGAAQRMIATVHGRGFRFVPPVEDQGRIADGEGGPEGGEDGPHEALPAEITKRPSVAVLPYTNLNHDPAEDYLADGISEDITTALAKNRWLLVIARNPAFAFRNSDESIRTIGAKLHADYIATGSVRKAGNRIRISAQVVDAGTEFSIWSERFDRDMVDVFDLQDEISDMIASRIEAELGLSEQRKAERKPRKNMGAWDLYQLGTAEFYKFTPESNRRAQELLRQSIGLDPEFSGAYSRVAYAIVLSMVYFDAAPDQALLDEALANAKRAVELDDQDANAYFTMGRVHLARCEYGLAIEALQHALNLNPSLAVTYCGLGDSLAYEGRLDESIEQFEIAVRLSPHDPFRWAFYSYRSLAHLFRGDYEDAAYWARTAVRIPNAQYWAKAHLAAALGHLGDDTEATSAVRDLLTDKPDFSLDFARTHLFYIKRSDQLEIYLDGLRKAGVS